MLFFSRTCNNGVLFRVWLLFQLLTCWCTNAVFDSNHDKVQCIQKQDELFCLSLESISFLSISSFRIEMRTDDERLQYLSGLLTLSTITSATTCIEYGSTTFVFLQIFDTQTSLAIGSNKTIVVVRDLLMPSSITLTDAQFTATFTTWTSKHQCLEIKLGNMFTTDHYNIHVDFYRISEESNPTRYDTVSSSTDNLPHLPHASTALWSTVICVRGSPIVANLDYVGADIVITSYWTQSQYNVLYINDIASTQFISERYIDYQGADSLPITAHFAIGDIVLKYWQSCSIACNDKFGPCWDLSQHQLLQEQFPLYMCLMLLLIAIIIMLMVATAYFGTKDTYKLSSGEVDYKALLWLMIELMDWWTDFFFVIFLYFNMQVITTERVPGLDILLILAVLSLLLTYITNMVYMVHYLQMWSAAHAPGITRLWLQEWSWFLISISMTFGGVHVALEFCNSLITPNLNIFSMHVPWSEMVRTRKDRFISNVFCQNIPFLMIYVFYLIEIKLFDTKETQSNITTYIGCMTTVFSIILSSLWAIYRRGYAQQHPLALYSVQIHFKTERWKRYYIHCHNRICRALQNGLNVRKTNLIILDQCSESYESMKIEARILRDTKVFGYKLPPVSNATARQILNCLISEFKQENMELKNFYAEHVNYGEGEYVYNHNTGVLVLCNGIKGCFCPSQKMLTHMKKTPRENEKAVQIAHWKRTEHMQNNNKKLYPTQRHNEYAQNHQIQAQNIYAYQQKVASASFASECALNEAQSPQSLQLTQFNNMHANDRSQGHELTPMAAAHAMNYNHQIMHDSL